MRKAPKYLYSIIIIMIILTAGCEEKYVTFGERVYTGESTASLNGREDIWKAGSYTTQTYWDEDLYWIWLDIRNGNNEQRQQMAIGPIEATPTTLVPGINPIIGTLEERTVPTVTFGSFVSDGDVICDRFTIDTSHANIVQIHQFNSDNHQIRGTFELKFIRTQNSPCESPGLADTLHFTNGIIEVNGLSSF